MNLSDVKEDINKCSKCGLCQAVCPVYKITGNECAVSKGKFVMLKGVIEGDLKLNKNINKYLDLCLKCGKCKDFCPSSIDVCKIFEIAKFQFAKNTFAGKFIFFLESKFVFGNILKFFKIFNPLFIKNVKSVQNNSDKKLKLIYFKGCVESIRPKTINFLKNLHDIEIIEKDFDCCGIPFLSSGNLQRYLEVKNHNLKLFNCEYDYIFTDCASCESSLKNYGINAKFLNLGELIAKLDLKFSAKNFTKVTFHKPCHLENIDFLPKLFANCKNIEYVEMKDFDECCGFAGEFAVKNPKISKSIAENKAQNIINTKADYVITTCPSCLMGLYYGLYGKKNAPEIVGLNDFIMMLAENKI